MRRLILTGFAVTMMLACRTATVADLPEAEQQAALNRDFPEVAALVAGHEQEPAEKVFKNIQVLQGVPAGRILRIMQLGYSRGLGVGCEHCHVENRWEVDEKRPKRAAREMAIMVREINQQQLSRMKNLDGDAPTVNCTTCHRGSLWPATMLPAKSAR
jgi:hypothetical protein